MPKKKQGGNGRWKLDRGRETLDQREMIQHHNEMGRARRQGLSMKENTTAILNMKTRYRSK